MFLVRLKFFSFQVLSPVYIWLRNYGFSLDQIFAHFHNPYYTRREVFSPRFEFEQRKRSRFQNFKFWNLNFAALLFWYFQGQENVKKARTIEGVSCLNCFSSLELREPILACIFILQNIQFLQISICLFEFIESCTAKKNLSNNLFYLK